MWIDKTGSNLTTDAVCAILNNSAGAAYDAATLEEAYRVGRIYQNGTLWFQRLA